MMPNFMAELEDHRTYRGLHNEKEGWHEQIIQQLEVRHMEEAEAGSEAVAFGNSRPFERTFEVSMSEVLVSMSPELRCT